jgi:small conductance mechanosensitive channel
MEKVRALMHLSNLGGTLIHNAIYLGIAFVLMVILTLVVTSGLLRILNWFLRSNILTVSEQVKQSIRRKIRRLALIVISVGTFLLTAGALLATWRKVRIDDLLRSGLSQMQTKDWVGLGLAVLKTLIVLLLAFGVARILVLLLHYLHERLQRAESLAGHRKRLSELLVRLRLAMSCTLLFSTLLLCAKLLGLSDGVIRFLWSISLIGVSVYVGRFAVGTAHLAIDVLFDLSDVLTRLESPLRYLGRFRHLSRLTKRTVDYFLFVGITTWTIDQITPGTWATHVGRLAIQTIAIFYISRVLVEVCVLFMNEFFLTRDQHTEAEFQQRQTLVPVAAGLLRYGIYFAAVVMILREAGIDPTPLLAGAGVAGVALGLGAQAFVGDIVAGFFILFENLFLVGDFIEVSGVKGRVEEIGVRVTRLRDEAGLLHAIPNGEVRKVSSHSKGYVNVVIDMPIPYGENLHAVIAALSRKTIEVRAGEPGIVGVTQFWLEDLRESVLLLRTVTMVKPGMAQDLSGVLRLAFWEALTAAGVSAPVARRMLVSPAPTPAPLSAPLSDSPRQVRETKAGSDIQRIKAYNLYRAFDVDGNRYLERADLDALARRVISHQGRAADSPLHDELRSRLASYWNEMVTLVDTNKDGRISQEEFLHFAAQLSADLSGAAGRCMMAVAELLFTIADQDGDGTIGAKEFGQCFAAYGIAESITAKGFTLIDSDDNGRITREEWQSFMRDVLQSQKLTDAAALIFGPGCHNQE